MEIRQWTDIKDRDEIINDIVLNADPTENGTNTWIVAISEGAFHSLRSEALRRDQDRASGASGEGFE